MILFYLGQIHAMRGELHMNDDTLKEAIRSARKDKKKGEVAIDEKEAAALGLKLIEKSKICLLGTNGDNGFPNIKAMFASNDQMAVGMV